MSVVTKEDTVGDGERNAALPVLRGRISTAKLSSSPVHPKRRYHFSSVVVEDNANKDQLGQFGVVAGPALMLRSFQVTRCDTASKSRKSRIVSLTSYSNAPP